MELLDQELQLQAAEADVTRGLLALNVAQDYLEALLAGVPNVMGSTTGTVTTAAGVETTVFPTGVLRIDRLQYLDPTSLLPAWELSPVKSVGGHATSRFWPWSLLAVSGSGKPRAYYTNARNIYWDPLPSGVDTVRWYGLQAASNITAGGTFAYPDTAMLPLAALAVALFSRGLGDDSGDYTQLADSILRPVVDQLDQHNRDGGPQFEYSRNHLT
jgi:hypothetical protein